jgi:hypothetical protein
MPRPTRPQLIYGSATVIVSTLAMLLLSEAQSTVAVLAVVVAGLALGLLVAITAATPLSARTGAGQRSRVAAMSSVSRPPARAAAASAAEPREHSLQR